MSHKIIRHILGRFVDNKSGSSRLRPVHGARHRDRQMRSMSKGRFTGKSARFGL